MSLPDYYTWKAEQLGITREEAKARCHAEGYGFGPPNRHRVGAADDGPEVAIIRHERIICGKSPLDEIKIDWDAIEREHR